MANSSTAKSGASTMAELMARQTASPVTIKRGDSVKATVTKLTKNEILLDIQDKNILIEENSVNYWVYKGLLTLV